jgi:hypothetical protein
MSPAATPSLSVIFPVFNGTGWIGESIGAVDRSIQRSGFRDAEILVIDDGSTDDTVVEIARTAVCTPTRVVSQANAGRFQARRRGLSEVRGDYVLFIDTRVRMHADSLAFVEQHLDEPDSQVWTADVHAAVEHNPLARFWRAIEHIAWRRYHGNPRWVRFGLDEFDYYPKGTTAFICPRPLLQEAFDDFRPTVADPTKFNDDTAVMRFIAARSPINIAPEYSCTYHARTTLKAFLSHAQHRGSVLVDGYLRKDARFAREIAAVLAVSPIGVIVSLRHPKLAIAGALAGSVVAAGAARVKGAETEDAIVFGALSVPFGVCYLSGLWRGAASRVELWIGRRSPELRRQGVVA